MSQTTPNSETVQVIAPDGTRGSVPVSQYAKASQMGYKLVDDKTLAGEAQTRMLGEHPVQAGIEGLARGASFGLSDVLAKSSGKDMQTLQRLKEANPIAAGAGEFAGMAIPSLLTGGAATAVTKGVAAKVAAKSLATRIAARGLAGAGVGAVEGAAFGAGQAISEDALGEADLTAEHLLSRMGYGALFGGAVGGALGAAAPALGAAKNKISEFASKEGGLVSRIREGLDSASKTRALKTASPDQRTMDKLVAKYGNQADEIAGDIMRGNNILKKRLAANSIDEVHTNVSAARKEIGSKIGEFRKKISSAAQEGDGVDVHNIISEMRAGLDKSASGAQITKRIESHLDGIEQRFAKQPMASIKEIQQEIKGLDGALPKNAHFTQEPSAYVESMKSLRAKLNEAADAASEKVAKRSFSPDDFQLYKQAKKEYGVLSDINKGTFKGVGRDIKNRVMSPTDYGATIGASVLTGNPVTGILAGVGHHVVRKYGSNVGSMLLERAAKLQWLASESSIVNREVGQSVQRYLKRIASPLATATRTTTRYGAATAGEAPRKVANVRQEYKDRVAEVKRITSDPVAMAGRVSDASQSLSDAAPKIAGALQQKAVTAASFLASKLPAEQHGSLLNLGKKDYEPSDAEVAKWMRYERAVRDPQSIMKDLDSGKLTVESVEAMKAVYPQMYQNIVMNLTEHLADIRESVPYDKRIQLGMLFNVPTDATLEPETFKAIQAAVSASGEQEQGSGMVKPSQGGVGKLSLASRSGSVSNSLAKGLDK